MNIININFFFDFETKMSNGDKERRGKVAKVEEDGVFCGSVQRKALLMGCASNPTTRKPGPTQQEL